MMWYKCCFNFDLVWIKLSTGTFTHAVIILGVVTWLRKKIIILHNFCSAVWLNRLCSDITIFCEGSPAVTYVNPFNSCVEYYPVFRQMLWYLDKQQFLSCRGFWSTDINRDSCLGAVRNGSTSKRTRSPTGSTNSCACAEYLSMTWGPTLPMGSVWLLFWKCCSADA